MIAQGGILKCPRCGYVKEASKTEQGFMRKSTVLITASAKSSHNIELNLPIGALYDDSVSCPRCKHKGVYYWRRAISSAESSDVVVKLYRCPSCGYEWSEGE